MKSNKDAGRRVGTKSLNVSEPPSQGTAESIARAPKESVADEVVHETPAAEIEVNYRKVHGRAAVPGHYAPHLLNALIVVAALAGLLLGIIAILKWVGALLPALAIAAICILYILIVGGLAAMAIYHRRI